MEPDRGARAERLAPYFEAQLRLAHRMAELTGMGLGEAARAHTNLHRRLGLGVPLHFPPSPEWRAYAQALEAARGLQAQWALTCDAFRTAREETTPLPGQERFGCFAFEPPNDTGAVKIHFYNRDTDAAGGPLATAKIARRRGDLAAMVRRIVEAHPAATHIVGRSWLYNLEAYRRLFPPEYAASRAPAPGPLHLSGTSSWGQLIDSREAIRSEVRDAFVANLATLDPERPWTAFPQRVLAVKAPLEAFTRFYGT